MAAKIINGHAIANDILTRVKDFISTLNLIPTLAIVQVGNSWQSNAYINLKKKAAESVGINILHCKLDSNTNQNNLISRIQVLNFDESVHGILVQLPFDSPVPIDVSEVLNTVSSDKDVDGLNDSNAQKLSDGDLSLNYFVSATALAVLKCILSTGLEIKGQRASVLGRGRVAGLPIFHLLRLYGAITNGYNSQLSPDTHELGQADVIVSAVGQPGLVHGSQIKPGCVAIDVGCSKDSTGHLSGDFDFPSVCSVASYVTPVPGGVGPVTIAMMLNNVLAATLKSFTPVHDMIK